MAHALNAYRAAEQNPYAAQDAQQIARQNCCDSECLKNLTNCIIAVAVAVFGILLILEWPILTIVAAPIVGAWAYSFVRNHLCCGSP